LYFNYKKLVTLINLQEDSMIINNESCTNVANTTLVRKLNLNTIKHGNPYRLEWLNDCGKVKVTKKVLVSSSENISYSIPYK